MNADNDGSSITRSGSESDASPRGQQFDLSVVIPIRNESRFIRQTLEQLLAQELGDVTAEFLVVDGMSTDDTCEIVEAVKSENPTRPIRLLENPRCLSSAARNIGLRSAAGRFVIVVDGHVYIPSSKMLCRCVELADEWHVRVVGRPQRLRPPGINRFQQLVASVRESFVGHSVESHIYSSNEELVSPISVGVMYDRTLALELGGFDEAFDAAEDLEFNYRLERNGERCLISPELEVFYYPRESLAGLLRQMGRYGLGRAKFLAKHPERLTVEVLIPAFTVLTAIVLLAFSFSSSAAAGILGLLTFAYAIVVVIANRRSLRDFGPTGLLAVPIAATIHLGLGIGFLRGVLAVIVNKALRGKSGP